MKKPKIYSSAWQGLFSIAMVALTVLPSGIFLFKHKQDMLRWAQVNEEVLQLKIDSNQRYVVQKHNARFLSNKHPESVEVFCQKISEETNPLERERSFLRTLIIDESRIISSEEFEYYQFLTVQNRLFLSQETASEGALTVLSFRKPIQCNEKDIGHLLKKLDSSINHSSPEPIFLKNWEMQKKKTPLGNEIWQVQATAIKREVLNVQ
ncbi:hypothetical protein [Chlamydiifrater volucris]|uniref:hypothetical protein n=1 Tax=Chlamydiifrater volucris TaxID=2681470 RepID=UPI001BCF4AE0|nr:hypothetical protein [Chlamydiifrater volucris]